MKWTNEWIEQGKSQGLREGRSEGRRDLLLQQLRGRFGAASAKLAPEINRMTDSDISRFAQALFDLPTLADVRT